MKKITLLLLTGILLTALAGCSSKTNREYKPAYGEKPANYRFKKIEDAKLELVFVGPKYQKAGTKGQAVFALKNVGSKTVRIEEWRMNEPDNLLLECQVWLPGQTEPDPDRWLSLDLPIKQPERRYNLELFPGNQARIVRDLDFVTALSITPGSERRYFIRATLNLTSVNCSSPVSALAVTSAD